MGANWSLTSTRLVVCNLQIATLIQRMISQRFIVTRNDQHLGPTRTSSAHAPVRVTSRRVASLGQYRGVVGGGSVFGRVSRGLRRFVITLKTNTDRSLDRTRSPRQLRLFHVAIIIATVAN